MKKWQRLTASLVLVFLLALSALAGEMDMGNEPPPPPTGQTSSFANTDATETDGEIATLLLGIAISVWQKLP